MSLIIQIVCDKCQGTSIPWHGTPTDVRVQLFPSGWFFDGDADLCPVCTGKDQGYWVSEPF